MGTRGCVAVGTPEKFRGLYNHWDSYPSGLGADVWNEWKRNPNLPKDLLNFDDWRAYLSSGICEYCGKKRGQPHSITINKFTMEPGGDPDELYHLHNEGDPEKYHITDESPGLLFISWVYVLDITNSARIHILAHVSDPSYKRQNTNPRDKIKLLENRYWDYGHCAYKHQLVKTIELNQEEPNWSDLEQEIYRSLDHANKE